MAHEDKIKDTDAFFVVDAITRQIINKTPMKIVLVQGDHNSERFTFSMPRYIEGHDMAESAAANLHFINPSKNVKGMYKMKDLRVDPDDSEKVLCSWVISGNATKESGQLFFFVEFVCYEGNKLVYRWKTVQHKGISVGESFDNAEEIAEMYADVLQQWHDEVFNAIEASNLFYESKKLLGQVDFVWDGVNAPNWSIGHSPLSVGDTVFVEVEREGKVEAFEDVLVVTNDASGLYPVGGEKSWDGGYPINGILVKVHDSSCYIHGTADVINAKVVVRVYKREEKQLDEKHIPDTIARIEHVKELIREIGGMSDTELQEIYSSLSELNKEKEDVSNKAKTLESALFNEKTYLSSKATLDLINCKQ